MFNNRQGRLAGGPGLAPGMLLVLLGLAVQPAGQARAQVPASEAPAASIDLGLTREPLEKLEKSVAHYGGKLGISVVDLRSGRTVIARAPNEPRNPASNAKLITAWAALSALGSQHRYQTGLYGRIRDGRVEQLVIRGDGDPSLTHDQLYAMVAELRRAGVRKIVDVIVDQSAFDDQHVPPAFEQQPDEWASFRAPVAAVSLDGNAVMLGVYPVKPGERARIRPVPPSLVEVGGEVATVDEGKPETVRVEIRPLGGGRLRAIFSGNIPVDSPAVRVWRRVDDPAALAGYALADIARELGIKVVGHVRGGHGPDLGLLAAHESEPLGQLLHALGKHSDNFYAEMIFKSLANAGPAADAPARAPATFDAARARVMKLLQDARLPTGDLVLQNGSGLFDADRVTPQLVTALLASAARDPAIGPEFIDQLAIGGVDGTLRDRFEGFEQRRILRAKSGTLAAVSALSGYVLASDGKPALAFSVLVDGVQGAAVPVRKQIDGFVATVASTAR